MLGAWVVFLLLAACSSQPGESAVEPPVEVSSQTNASPQPAPPKIECAAAGEAGLAPVCTLDQADTANGTILTLRHPDGAFRRLQITRDGRGVIAADGAEPARVTPLAPDRIEVELGGARYRLPATVRGQPQ